MCKISCNLGDYYNSKNAISTCAISAGHSYKNIHEKWILFGLSSMNGQIFTACVVVPCHRVNVFFRVIHSFIHSVSCVPYSITQNIKRIMHFLFM